MLNISLEFLISLHVHSGVHCADHLEHVQKGGSHNNDGHNESVLFICLFLFVFMHLVEKEASHTED